MRPYRIKNIIDNQQGIALISALLITLLLTLVVVALSYRVGMLSLGARDHVIKSQSIYTAEVGLNKARYFLHAGDCDPGKFEACIPGLNYNSFVNISTAIKGVFTTATKPGKITLGGVDFDYDSPGSLSADLNTSNYTVYAKRSNLGKVIHIMAVSSRPGSKEGDMTQTIIDAGLLYDDECNDSKQKGGSAARKGKYCSDVTSLTAANR